MSNPAVLTAALRELLPDASQAELDHLVQSSTSLEHAIALRFSKQDHTQPRSARPSPRARVEETVDDDDGGEADAAGTARAGQRDSEGEEHIEADEVDEADDSRLSAPPPPRPRSSVSSSPAVSPRKPRGRAAASQKRKAPGSGGGSGSGGKRRKGQPTRPKGQRSIASFFSGATPPSAPNIPRSPSAAFDAAAVSTGRSIGAFTTSSPSASDAKNERSESSGGPVDASAAVDVSSASSSSSPAWSSVPPIELATGPPCWTPPSAVPYLHLARTFRAIEVETGRILITNLLTLMLWRVLDLSPLDLLPTTFLSLNHLAPPYENLQLHIGGSAVSRVIREATGRSRQQMHDDYVRLGDLGDVAQLYRVTQPLLVRPTALTVRDVYAKVYGLSRMVGNGMTKKKEDVVRRLLLACREYETTYIVRTVLQDMRIGGAVTTVLNALAKAVVLHAHFTSKDAGREHGTVATWERVLQCTNKDCASPLLTLAHTVPSLLSHPAISSLPDTSLHALIRTATSTLRHSYSQHPNMRSIISHVLSHSLAIYTLLSAVHLQPGTPCKPMLGKISKGLHDMLKRLRGAAFSCEIKYDGLRAQIHLLKDGSYRFFSRHLMEQTERWRDLWPLLDTARYKGEPSDDAGQPKREAVSSFIVDAEIVGIEVDQDGEDEEAAESFRILPFQAVTTRKRKVDGRAVDQSRVEVRCMVYVFDLILLNDQPLLQRSLGERRALLSSHFREVPAGVQFVEHIDVSKEESECIAAAEEDDDAEDDSKQSTARSRATTSKGDEDADEASGSEPEEDATPAEAAADDDDRLFRKASGQRNPAAPSSTAADEFDVADVTALASVSGTKPSGVQLESLSEDSVERGAAAYARVLRFLHDVAIVRGEGLMAKSLSPHSTYEPDIRTDQWVKCKRDYMQAGLGVGDSLDVVPIGAWYGNGRKAGWWSPVLLAVWNPDSEQLETLCKCMSGFSDALYIDLVRSFKVIPRPKPYYNVDEQLTPTAWFEPDRVWEIRGADLTISPKHTAAKGLVDDARGISLRFPRYIRAREDKAMEDATTSQQIAELYRMQARTGTNNKRGRR